MKTLMLCECIAFSWWFLKASPLFFAGMATVICANRRHTASESNTPPIDIKMSRPASQTSLASYDSHLVYWERITEETLEY